MDTHPIFGKDPHTDSLSYTATADANFVNQIRSYEIIVTGVHVPEPSTLSLVGVTLSALVIGWRKRRKHAA